ncbi:MAG: hypothetical protein NC418_07865 [Muribaculaceae bacterium]|nr:hypothetical protein [Muribaculaceae bacterium]MCM1141038.1 hypothetical protein [Muribaculum sp.]
MDRNELIRRVKRGEDTRQIKMLYFFNLLPRFPATSRFMIRRGENPMHYIYLLKPLGFQVIDTRDADYDAEEWQQNAAFYHLILGEFELSIYWDTNKGKDDLGFFSIVFTTPDREKHELGGYHIKVVEMIQNTIENWYEWMAQWKELEKEIPKIRKSTEVANNTLDAIIPSIMRKNGWDYHIERICGDTILKIKVAYHRCIEIKILPTMDLPKLLQLFDRIPNLSAVLSDIGVMNIAVKNYGNDIKWTKNDSATAQDLHRAPSELC